MALGFTGPGQPGAIRFSSTRGRIQGSYTHGLSYPSPFFDVAQNYMPRSVRELFRDCRYYFMTNPLVNATVFKLSEYPITEVVVDHDSGEVARRWGSYLKDTLRYDAFRVECGLDYHVYGNCFVSISYPFRKYLECAACRRSEPADKLRDHWQFTNYRFLLTCPWCRTTADAKAKDWYYRNPHGIRLMRWNPEDFEITYNDVTGDATYYYTIPRTVQGDITVGKKDVIERTPAVFLEAMRARKGIVFSKDGLFHFKRPNLATQDRGFGLPLLMPVLKDVFYLQIMKKAQESILLEHILPLRVLFPQAGSGTSDPYTSVNLVDWREHIAAEIARWRHDPNYIPVMPIPVGNQTIGGDGRALLLAGEIQQWSEHIMMGMGVPREFLIGGMSYAGTNVSLRMLENQFLTYIDRHKEMARWIVRSVSAFLGWPTVGVRFKPFKMADDLQRKAFDFQLNQAGKISDTSLLSVCDYDASNENKTIEKETSARMASTLKQQLATAEIQGQSQLVMAKYQVKAQQAAMAATASGDAPGEPGGGEGSAPAGALPPGPPQESQSPLGADQRMQPGQAAADIPTMALMQAQVIAKLPPQEQGAAVANLQAVSPELADLVVQMLKQMGVQADPKGGQAPAVDMRPLPEQRGPRRQGSPV